MIATKRKIIIIIIIIIYIKQTAVLALRLCFFTPVSIIFVICAFFVMTKEIFTCFRLYQKILVFLCFYCLFSFFLINYKFVRKFPDQFYLFSVIKLIVLYISTIKVFPKWQLSSHIWYQYKIMVLYAFHARNILKTMETGYYYMQLILELFIWLQNDNSNVDCRCSNLWISCYV